MSNKTAIRPLGDRVLVQPKEEKEVTRGGIIIPDTAKEKPMEGTVIAVGIKRDKDGKEVPFDVKPGDTVLLPKRLRGLARPKGDEPAAAHNDQAPQTNTRSETLHISERISSCLPSK